MKILSMLSFVVLTACSSPQKASINPQSGVITGTLDQNLLQIAGKPVAISSDGVQTVALANAQISKDPCDGNDMTNFNGGTNSATAVALIPPASGQNLYVCSIHVHGNFDQKITESVVILEGGGNLCTTSPTYLEGDSTDGVLIAGGGNGGFIQGGAGATIYKTTNTNRGICAKAAGNNHVRFSGTYVKQ